MSMALACQPEAVGWHCRDGSLPTEKRGDGVIKCPLLLSLFRKWKIQTLLENPSTAVVCTMVTVGI